MKSAIVCFAMLLGLSASAQRKTEIEVELSPRRDNAVISRYIYSHFAEHLGRGIYGGIFVGDSSPVPNTGGVRNDVIAALRKLKIPALRWPGGCFADTYHWKDGVGPRSKRAAIVNQWWGGVIEDNSFGTHEFLNMCELLGADPYIAGNVGSGTVQELSDWVAYTTTGTKNPMSDWRRQNGRGKPWNVRFWGLGNEAWGCGGNMTAEYYSNEFRKYATFMAASEGRSAIFRIASGANSADYLWTETLMRSVPLQLIEGIGLHHYAVIDWDHKGPATGFSTLEYFRTMQRALLMDTLVSRHSAIMDRYDPGRKVALVVDEWGGWYDVEAGTNPGFLYQQNTMRDAMIAGVTLNIFNNHCARVRMANLAQCVNVLQAVILTKGPQLLLTPTYHVMEMYSVHQDATLLPLHFHSDDWKFQGATLPALSASASRDKNGLIHISLVNIDPENAQEVVLHFGGGRVSGVSGRILAAAAIQDHNTFEEPHKVEPQSFSAARLEGDRVEVRLPGASVLVLTLPSE